MLGDGVAFHRLEHADGGGGLFDLFGAGAVLHLLELGFGFGLLGFRAFEGGDEGGVVEGGEGLAGFDAVAFIDGERRDAAADPEAEVDLPDVDISVEGENAGFFVFAFGGGPPGGADDDENDDEHGKNPFAFPEHGRGSLLFLTVYLPYSFAAVFQGRTLSENGLLFPLRQAIVWKNERETRWRSVATGAWATRFMSVTTMRSGDMR